MSILGSLKSFVISTIFPVAEYNAAPATLSDGDEGPLQIDPKGNLRTTSGPSTVSPADVIGTAPDGSGGGNATALTSQTASIDRGVIVSNDMDSPGRLHVSYSAVALAASSIQLDPGDSTPPLKVANASAIFVNGSIANVKYRVSVLP